MSPTHTLFRRLFWLSLAGIAYGSLYPFKLHGLATGWADFVAFISHWHGHQSKSDIVGNILLFIPAGYFFSTGWPQARVFRTLKTAIGLVLFAFSLQVIQLWLAYRVPEIRDVLWNTVGLAIGLGVALLPWHRRFIENVVVRHWHPFSFLLICAWLVYKLYPFVPSLDIQNLKDSLKPLIIYQQFSWAGFLHDCAAWFTIGYMVREVWNSRWLLWLLGAGVLVAEVLIVRNQVNLHNTLAVLAACTFWSLHPLRPRWAAGALCALLIGHLLINGMHPWYLGQPHFNWIPFSGFLTGSMTINALSLLEKCFFYGSLIYLLAECRLNKTWVLAIPVGLTLGIELTQIHLPGRTAELTDPILCGLLFVAFYPLHHRAKSR